MITENLLENILGLILFLIMLYNIISERKRYNATHKVKQQPKKKSSHKKKKETKIMQFSKQDHIQAMWDEMNKH